MAKKVLLAYATNYGSTLEVAEAITAELRKDVDVDIQPAKKVRALKDYQAVILGAPLYMFRWHKDTLRFLTRFSSSLKNMPVAVFALGPTFKGDEDEFKEARGQLDNELEKFRWFKPVAVEVFGGKVAPEELRFPFKLFFRQVPAADFRDWKAIQSWARGLVKKL